MEVTALRDVAGLARFSNTSDPFSYSIVCPPQRGRTCCFGLRPSVGRFSCAHPCPQDAKLAAAIQLGDMSRLSVEKVSVNLSQAILVAEVCATTQVRELFVRICDLNRHPA